MNRTDLQQLAKKYLEGKATTEEKRVLNHWYDTIHDNRLVEIVLTDTPETENDIKDRIFDSVKNEINAKNNEGAIVKNHPAVLKRIAYRIAYAAAVILIITSVAFYFSRDNNKMILPGTELVNVTATRIMKITLPDGSKVWLNAHSTFKYPSSFAGKKLREVELVEGRAFFDITHQSSHPFIVKTKKLNITVLGTSFDVRTYEKEGTTKVSVVTGKVGITLPGHANEPAVMLLPKQQIVLSKITRRLTRDIIKEPVINLWCKSPLVFEQESLDNVFKAIEKQYNTQIEVDNKKLLNDRISITLSNQRLDTIMEILSFTEHFRYHIANDSTVIIK
jgi:transmembrane sensor